MLTRETLAKTVRSALVENWKDHALGGKWDEDILLTGCKAAKYADPEEAANNHALFVADAVLALLSASPPADVAGMREEIIESVIKRFPMSMHPSQAASVVDFILSILPIPEPEPKTDAAVKALVEALANLTRDCTASDFNEHWDSFKNAEATLAANGVK